MINVLISTLPIFLLIFSGYFVKQYFIKNQEVWKSLEALTYYLLFPCLLTLSISKSNLEIGSYTKALLVLTLVTFIVSILVFVVKFMFKLDGSIFTSLYQGSTRYNSYVFLALSYSLFGDNGLAVTAIYIAYMIILTNLLSVLVMNIYGNGNQKSLWSLVTNIFKNPLILSSLLGIVLYFLDIKITSFLSSYMQMLGQAASPLSLLSVGAGLKLLMTVEKYKVVSMATIFKLVLMPLLTIYFLWLFNIHDFSAKIAVLYACLPCAGNAYILSRQMGGDAESMASIISLTTLLSFISTSLIMYVYLI